MAQKHYEEQRRFARDYVLPFLRSRLPNLFEMRVLEIGCAEAGLLAVLAEQGVTVCGIELSEDRVAVALAQNPQLDVRVGDLTDPKLPLQFERPFDLIILRDVIEHVPNREAAFQNLSRLLRPGGWVYVTFPPRFSPFAGHQQNAKTALRRLPWVQLWPAGLVRWLGRRLGEPRFMTDHIIHNGRTGLSLRAFRRFYRKAGFTEYHRDWFLSRPIYRQRFGWKVRRFPAIPILSEFFVTGCEVLLKKG